jgi:hypothetical protein
VALDLAKITHKQTGQFQVKICAAEITIHLSVMDILFYGDLYIDSGRHVDWINSAFMFSVKQYRKFGQAVPKVTFSTALP